MPRTDAPTAIQRLALDLREARQRRHLTVAQLAYAIGISESALRRLENGTSRNAHGETLCLILAWACTRGYSEFAGFRIRPAAKALANASQEALF
jgi:transcriptional regulator with XRE-family HTH domain